MIKYEKKINRTIPTPKDSNIIMSEILLFLNCGKKKYWTKYPNRRSKDAKNTKMQNDMRKNPIENIL